MYLEQIVVHHSAAVYHVEQGRACHRAPGGSVTIVQ